MLLKALGSLFVYRSPKEKEGFKNHLMLLTCKKLRVLAGTNSHYSKAKLVSMILEDRDNKTS
tara:strand:- start:287 stop:472 length:186 start_codon:yes stop_codon:yes gene_type:complete